MIDNRTALAIQVHEGALRLRETGQYTLDSAIRESMAMMKEVFVQEVRDKVRAGSHQDSLSTEQAQELIDKLEDGS